LTAPAAEEPGLRPEATRRPLAQWERVLFAASLAVFLISRLVGLERFPIFFFCDEAVQTVQASELIHRGFRDESGQLFPTYFRNSESLNLSLGVYAQVLPTALFGRSIGVTRGTQVLLLLPAMAAVGLLLRDFLHLRFWWVGILMLSTAPAWFLHSRIAFEFMLAAGGYIGFLYFYLRYRSGRPANLFGAIVCGALTFYGYNTFQPVLAVTAALLFLVDLPYHWRQRRTVAAAVPLLLLAAAPYVRFARSHPQEIRQRLQGLDSYWVDRTLTLPQKLGRFGSEYIQGFSPAYWFGTEPTRELPRHEMGGYPFLFVPLLPLAVAGILLCIARWGSPPHRVLLAALAAAPVGGALVHVGVTRAMTLVVVVCLLACLALDPILAFLSRYAREGLLAGTAFLFFTGLQAAMLGDSLVNGPTWFSDYGLYGLQYGARQVFEEVRAERSRFPNSPIFVSPVWANGPDDLRLFFLPDDRQVFLNNIDYFAMRRRDLSENAIQVLTAGEWLRLRRDPKFVIARTERVICYPDGSPGFYFLRARYSDRFDELLAAEVRQRRMLVAEEIFIEGEPVCTAHTRLDLGAIANLFDGRIETLARTAQVNPAVVELRFETPRLLRAVEIIPSAGDHDVSLKARLEPADGSRPLVYERTYTRLPHDPPLELDFPGARRPIRVARFEIRVLGVGEDVEVHLREMTLR